MLVDNIVADLELMREIGRKNAEILGIKYLGIAGRSSELFQKTGLRSFPDKAFIRRLPGEEITQTMFIG